MTEVVWVALISCGATFITLIGGLWVARNNNKKDMSISHRKSLSEDEQKFRTDLLTEVDSYRDKIESLMEKVDKLSVENAELKGINIKLLAKMDVMQESLDRFSHSTCTSTSTETRTIINPITSVQI